MIGERNLHCLDVDSTASGRFSPCQLVTRCDDVSMAVIMSTGGAVLQMRDGIGRRVAFRVFSGVPPVAGRKQSGTGSCTWPGGSVLVEAGHIERGIVGNDRRRHRNFATT